MTASDSCNNIKSLLSALFMALHCKGTKKGRDRQDSTRYINNYSSFSLPWHVFSEIA